MEASNRPAWSPRIGVLTYPLLLGNWEHWVKHYLMVYDHLWVPGLESLFGSGDDEVSDETLASIEWLIGKDLIRDCPIDLSEIAAPDETTDALVDFYLDAESVQDQGFPTAEEAATALGASVFNMDMALSRLIAYLAWRDDVGVALPAVFPYGWDGAEDDIPPRLGGLQSVMSVAISQLPSPRDSLPLEDLVDFKTDVETQYKYRRFWHWAAKLAGGGVDPGEVRDELEFMLVDYDHHVRQLTRRVKRQRLELLISLPLEILEDVVKLRWASIPKRVFEVGRRQIAAQEAELKAPSSEIAYLIEASRFLEGGTSG